MMPTGGVAANMLSETCAGHAHLPSELLDEARPYAVVDFDGSRQYVEEGASIALLKKSIGEVRGGCRRF